MTPQVWVTSYNYSAYTVQSVRSILATVPADVVVGIVDDCSQPEHLERLREFVADAPRPVKLISHDGHKGQTYGYNLVLKQAPEDSPVALFNNDTIAGPGWLEPLLAAIAPGVGLVSPCSNQPGHVPAQQVRRFLPRTIDFDPNVPANTERTAEALRTAPAEPIVLEKVNGFAFVVTPEARRVVGLFDERKPTVGNEDNYRGRCIAAGLKCLLTPRAFVYHYKDVTLHRGVHRVGKLHRIPGAK